MQTKTSPSLFKEVVYGTRPVMEALESGQEINKLLILRGAQSENVVEIVKWAQSHRIPFQKVPMEKLNRVTRKNHQGVIALLSPIQYDKLETVIPALFESGVNPLVVALDGVTDVRNLGAICRSAECMGAQVIVLPQRGGAMITGDAVKTSAGAIFNLKICRVDHIGEAIIFLKNSGLQIVACSEKGKKELPEATFTNPTTVIFGAEDIGIDRELEQIANQVVRIPMAGKTQSLNVAVSAGVVLYECLKQRAASESA